MRILVDCDGVLADFATACVQWINKQQDTKFVTNQINQFDIFEALGVPQLKSQFHDYLKKPGWCSSIKPYFGAKRFVSDLQDYGEVFIVTAPMHSPYWVYERTSWLKEHIGVDAKHVVYVDEKQLIKGDVFIDDSLKNCVKWNAEHPDKLTLLMDAPYNRSSLEESDILRMSDYDDVMYEVFNLVEIFNFKN